MMLLGRNARFADHLTARNVAQGAPLGGGSTYTNTYQRTILPFYRGADKSLAQPGRKKITATEDFEFPIYNHNWRNISIGRAGIVG